MKYNRTRTVKRSRYVESVFLMLVITFANLSVAGQIGIPKIFRPKQDPPV